MPQGPLGTNVAQNPAKDRAPLNVDASGRLLVAVEEQQASQYVTVAASTTQALGAAGAKGDVLNSLLIIPGSTSPGSVQIKDGGGAAITVFDGGATSVADLAPISVPLNAPSAAGGWSVITGAGVTALAVGQFTN